MPSPDDWQEQAAISSPSPRSFLPDRDSHGGSAARKHPPSWNRHPPPPTSDGPGRAGFSRLTKRRAPRACVSCRDRKVRCDVMSGGSPCTNCRLDNVECILKESNRGKHNSANHKARMRRASILSEARQPSPTNTADVDMDVTATTSASASGTVAISAAVPGAEYAASNRSHHSCDSQAHSNANEELPSGYEGQDGHQGTEAASRQTQAHTDGTESASNLQSGDQVVALGRQEQYQIQYSRGGSVTPAASSIPGNNPPTSDYLVALAFQDRDKPGSTRLPCRSSGRVNRNRGVSTSPRNHDQADSHQSLPHFIRPHPSHLNEDDIAYLARKDCLTVPDDQLRDELIRVYVFIVHPFMPAVDLANFLGPIAGSDESGNISLLLFQAIMFASVTFVDSQLLQSRGFESKRAARKVFFDRVKHLYSLDYEEDRLTLVQVLLLMTYWYDSDGDDKHTWYWMGIAITTAQVEGLHRDTEEACGMTDMGRLRRRAWWSCVIRDRLLGLGIRRPSRIRGDEFSVEPLRQDDFDLEPPSPAVARLLAAPSYTDADPSVRIALATICVDLSKLCVVIGRILHSQYTIGSTTKVASNYLRKAFVRPKSSEEQGESFGKCDTALQEWIENCAQESRYVPGVREPRTASRTGGPMIRLHQALLYMNYLTALGALHRPQVFYSGSESTDIARKVGSKRKVTDAAVAITKLAFELQSTNQMSYAPTSSIPAFLSAALIHLLNTRSSDEETRNISIGRFCQCLDALHQLQCMYAAADQAVYIINNVLQSGGLTVPLLGIGNPAVKQNGLTTASTPGWKSRGMAGRSQGFFSEIFSSRVATAYPSPAPVVSHGAGTFNFADATAVVDSPSMGNMPPTTEGPPGVGYGQFAMPPFTNICNNQDEIHPDRALLQADSMAGAQFDLDTWYDVGDILDPALMNFETEPRYVTSELMPM